MRVRRLPADDAECGWRALLPAPPPPRRLAGVGAADCAIIGAGFTGLAAARRLAAQRPEWQIAVLDAQRVGDGASGRNSGFVVDVGHYDPARGVEGNRRLVRLGRAGLAALREVVHAHGIGCDWTEGGRYHGAAGATGLRALATFAAGLDAMGEAYEPLDRGALATRIGSAYYAAGAHTPGAVTVQPAALVRGLAATLPTNVMLFECSPVHAVERAGSGFRLTGAAGSLRAERVVVAANGGAAALGWLRRQVLPLATFASLTRPLTAAETAALGGDACWGLVSEAAMGTTLRRLSDGRVLVRNSVRYCPTLGVDAAQRARARAAHRHALGARFPALARVDFEHTWAGLMGASFNGAHFFGRLAPNLFAAAGYNGVGIAMGTVSGLCLADLASGCDSPPLADLQALPPPTPIPIGLPLGIGVRTTLAYLGHRARGE
jgi:glycine/D-amino acid oxidase-like deaminating enzyme